MGMRRAGCRGVEFGIDSASPSVLRALGKPFAVEDIGSAARACREAGLPATTLQTLVAAHDLGAEVSA